MDTVKINHGNTLMIAHRGLSGIELENTCPAFVAAGNRSYWGIETDVHVTADGKLVVIHDDVTGRVSETDIAVEGSTYDELRALELKTKAGDTRIDLKIPSLKEYLQICRTYDKMCVLELKNPFSREELQLVLKAVKETVPLEQMVFISFEYEPLCVLRELEPEAHIQFLCSCEVDEALIAKLKAYRLDLDIRYTMLTKEAIDLLHKNGIVVNCWTVDDAEKAEQLTVWGVDFITSNILE